MKQLIFILCCLFGALLPDIALADTIKPLGGTDWDLFVFGNGLVVREILTGVSLLMVGHSSAFTTLLLFMATLGFLSLAIAAGFDPGKNLLKMFSYIIVVWMVSYGSTRLTANVVISDMALNDASTAATSVYRVADVPALVALPAALTSQVGVRFTQFIETYFSGLIGSAFTTAGAGAGQFNLFNKMIQESSQFVFKDPALKKSLSAYSANCIVPAMALGRLTGPNGSKDPVVGLDALLKTTNYMAMLGSAASPSILTQYYTPSMATTPVNFGAYPEASGLSADQIKQSSSMGVMLTCQSAYTQLSLDVANEANNLVAAGNAAWAKSGIQVTFEEATSMMLAKGAAGGSVAADFSRPSGYIMQQSFMNQMSGSFREAAIQTGNNEMMQSAAMAQAEASQKSAWVAGFSIFNNMMGYVFTVLQAFIFALTPIVVIALMIPGMGKGIFVNYAQVLIWLTLWSPMLSIINFIITLFGSQAFAESIGNGINAENRGIMAQSANDLVIAAQFLGTMVPLLTWGIVKGAMAFTEFISHGVGSSFASSAGASAATGNMSMNNLSMDNTSMNKYSTMSSSAVGNQAIQASTNAGALMVQHDGAGEKVSMNGSDVDFGKQMSSKIDQNLQKSQSIGHEQQAMSQQSLSTSSLLSTYANKDSTSSQKAAAQTTLVNAVSAGLGIGKGEALSIVENASIAHQKQAQEALRTGNSQSLKGSVSGGIDIPVIGGAKVTAETGVNRSRDTTNSDSTSVGKGTQVTATESADLGKLTHAVNNLQQKSDNHSSEAGTGQGKGTRASRDESAVLQQSASEAYKSSLSYQESLSETKSLGQSFGVRGSMDMTTFNNQMAAMDAAGGATLTEGQMRQEMAGLQSAVTGHIAGTQGAFDAKTGQIASAKSALEHGVRGAPASVAPGVSGAIKQAESDITNGNAAAVARRGAIEGQAAAMGGKVNSGGWIPNSPGDLAPGQPGKTQSPMRARQAVGAAPK